MPHWQPSAEPETLRQRAAILTSIRSFFGDRGVLEVHTPLLGRSTVTDPDVEAIAVPGYGYLQTSPEYFMKRLLAAGVPSCYQLASAFRHEERGRLHSCEFMMLEWYRLGYDHRQLMTEVAELVDLVLGPADVASVPYAELVGDMERPRAELDLSFAQGCEQLSGRWFVTHYPAEQAALARLEADDPRWAARFELIVDGIEIANGYWELTEPAEHRRRFDEDLARRAARGLPTHVADEAFLAALDAGLPACAGVALGVDRLVMLALGKSSLDEVLTFRS